MLWSLDHSLAQMIIVMYCWMCLIIFESRVFYVHTPSYRIKTHHFIKSVKVFVFPRSSGPWPDHPEPCAQTALELARWSGPTLDHPDLGVRLYIGPRLRLPPSLFFLSSTATASCFFHSARGDLAIWPWVFAAGGLFGFPSLRRLRSPPSLLWNFLICAANSKVTHSKLPSLDLSM